MFVEGWEFKSIRFAIRLICSESGKWEVCNNTSKTLESVQSTFVDDAIPEDPAAGVSHSHGPTPEQRHDLCFALVWDLNCGGQSWHLFFCCSSLNVRHRRHPLTLSQKVTAASLASWTGSMASLHLDQKRFADVSPQKSVFQDRTCCFCASPFITGSGVWILIIHETNASSVTRCTGGVWSIVSSSKDPCPLQCCQGLFPPTHTETIIRTRVWFKRVKQRYSIQSRREVGATR